MNAMIEGSADGRQADAGQPASPATPARRSPRPPNGQPASASRSNSSEPRTRGKLILSEQVIGKIASQSASEVAAAGGETGGFLGIGQHSDLGARPTVDVELREKSADLFISVALPYGMSIRRTTQEVRDRVSRRVEQLTGVAVHRVDVDVSMLVLPDPDQSEGKLR